MTMSNIRYFAISTSQYIHTAKTDIYKTIWPKCFRKLREIWKRDIWNLRILQRCSTLNEINNSILYRIVEKERILAFVIYLTNEILQISEKFTYDLRMILIYQKYNCVSNDLLKRFFKRLGINFLPFWTFICSMHWFKMSSLHWP